MNLQTSMKIFTVTELTAQIKGRLEQAFPLVKVEGEVSNLRHQSSGHLYFTLKDGGAQIPVALFRGIASTLKQLPKDGNHIVITAELSVYPPRGAYQLIAKRVEYAGTGRLLMLLHQRKEELAKRGWFAQERKKTLPKLPQTIGVVTSPTGSVIQDILQILSRRFQGFQLLLNPVKVQGEGAAEEIAKAIEEMNRYQLCDVLIVGRGGGSLEDLWPFNEEVVAKAIFDSKIPVISAVGHETDVSISDFVADLRAPTPSAAAELVIAEREGQANLLMKIASHLEMILKGKIDQRRKQVTALQKHPCFSSPYFLLGQAAQRLDEISSTLESTMSHACERRHLKLSALQSQLSPRSLQTMVKERRKKLEEWEKKFFLPRMQTFVEKKREKLKSISSHLQSIDPKNLLSKGYSLLFDEKSNSVILSSHQLKKGSEVRLQLHDGIAKALIEEVNR